MQYIFTFSAIRWIFRWKREKEKETKVRLQITRASYRCVKIKRFRCTELTRGRFNFDDPLSCKWKVLINVIYARGREKRCSLSFNRTSETTFSRVKLANTFSTRTTEIIETHDHYANERNCNLLNGSIGKLLCRRRFAR